jgi:O-antigen/teichoic acid export membrane protein
MKNSSHIKNLFKHAVIYGSAGILSKAIGFIMLPIYSHQLQAEGYGVIGMIDTVLQLLTLVIGYGISGAMSRFYYETDDARRRKLIVSTTITLMFFLVVAVTLPVLFFSRQVAYLAFGRGDWAHYIVLAIFAFMANMTSKNAENYILILQKSLFLSIVSLVRLIFGLALNIYFIVLLKMGVLGYLYASLIEAVGHTLFSHVYAFAKVGFGYDRRIARQVLGFSLPMLPGYIAMFIRGNADRVILRTYLGLSTVGVFEVLFKFATLIGFFVVEPFSKIWQVKRFEVCDLENGPDLLARVFTYHMAIMLLVGLFFSLEIPVAMRLMTPKEFWLSGFIVFFAVMSRVLNGAYYHLFFGLLYAKKTFKISILQTATAIVSLALTYPLILLYGLPGTVVASLLSVVFQCTLGFIMARSYYYVPYAWKAVSSMTLLMIGLYWLAKDFSFADTWIGPWIQMRLAPLVRSALVLLSLDQFKNGKLVSYLVDGLTNVCDGLALACYCMLFVVGLVLLKVIPAEMVGRLLRVSTLRNPTRIFS